MAKLASEKSFSLSGCGGDGDLDECCKWCLRSFGMPNPIVKRRTLHPRLQRRAPRSLECVTCPKVLHQAWLQDDEDESSNTQEKEQFERDLRANSDKFEAFTTSAAQYEQDRNDGVPLTRHRARKLRKSLKVVGSQDDGESDGSGASC